jgi:tetratricopeptide (TPR) repeat protein
LTNPDRPRFRWFDLAIAILLITVVPPTFNDFVVQRQLIVLDEAARNLQLPTALRLVRCLNSFDCSVPEFSPQDTNVSELARNRRLRRNSLGVREQAIRESIANTENRIANYPKTTTDDQKVGLALDYYSLGNFDEAKQILSQNDLANDHEWGALVMGYIAEQQAQPIAAAEHYQRAIELESATASPRANRLNSAYERLANSLRVARQGAKAEAVLRDGMEKFPQIADRLTLQLGEHYLQAGRSQEAVNAFSSLVTRDDLLGARARSQINAIKSSISSCFVRVPSVDRSADPPR